MLDCGYDTSRRFGGISYKPKCEQCKFRVISCSKILIEGIQKLFQIAKTWFAIVRLKHPL